MKKYKESLALALVFGTVIGVSGCNKNKNNNEETPFRFQDVIEQNAEKIALSDFNDHGVTGYVNMGNFPSMSETTIVDENYSNYGVLVVKNSSNHIGFYSLFYQKYLLAPKYISEWVEYKIIADSNVGHFIVLEYEGVYHLYDAFGNELYTSKKEIKIKEDKSVLVNGSVYVTVQEFVDGEFKDVGVKKYTNDLTIENVDAIPKEIVVSEEDDGELEFGDLFVSQNKIDLKNYGLDGKYLLKKDKLYTVFNSSDNLKVSTFSIPVDNYVIINGKILYQTEMDLPEDSTSYTFAAGGSKVLVKTYSIDILTGKASELQLNKYISSINEYKDENGLYKYGVATVFEIDDNRNLLSTPKTILVDENVNVIKEVTGYELDSFVKIGKNYYNKLTKIIYDSEMKELAYIGDINPTHLEKDEIFVGVIDGKNGAVGYDGKVVIPFIYDSLQPLEEGEEIDFKDDCLIARKGEKYYRVNKKIGETTDLGKNVSAIYENLYVKKNDDGTSYTFMSQNEDYYVYNVDSSSSVVSSNTSKMYLNEIFGEYVLTKIKLTGGASGNQSVYFTHKINSLSNSTSFVSVGEEITVHENVGYTYQDAIEVTLGNNKVTLHGEYDSKYSYLEFTPSKTGEYIFEFENIFSEFHVEKEDRTNVYTATSTDKNRKAFVVELEASKKYYIKGIYLDEEYTYTTVKIRENTGEFLNNPVTLPNYLNEGKLNFSNVGDIVLHVKYTAYEDNDYIFEINEGFSFLVKKEAETIFLNTNSMHLAKGDTLLFKISKLPQATSNEAKLNISLKNSVVGTSLLNPKKVKQVNVINELSPEVNQNKAIYSYTHEGNKEMMLISIDSTSLSKFVTTKLYNEKYELLGEFTSKSNYSYVFSKGQKVFFETQYESTTPDVYSTIKINNIELKEQVDGKYNRVTSTSTSIDFYKFIPSSTGIYGFYSEFDMSGCDNDIVVYDDEYNVIDTYESTTKGVKAMTSKLLMENETYYIKVSASPSSVSSSGLYQLKYDKYSDNLLYTIENDFNNPFYVTKEGLIIMDLPRESSNFHSAYLIRINTESEVHISFNYSIKKVSTYSNKAKVQFEFSFNTEENFSKDMNSEFNGSFSKDDIAGNSTFAIKVSKENLNYMLTNSENMSLVISNLVIKFK